MTRKVRWFGLVIAIVTLVWIFQKIGQVFVSQEIPTIDLATKAQLKKFAEEVTVYPIGTITWDGHRWGKRFEVTFEDYLIFFRFKQFAQTISKNDFKYFVASIEEATPKERALILTLIYIFEWTHRPRPLPRGLSRRDFLLPREEVDPRISLKEWRRYISVLTRYSHDQTVAFPAIDTDLDQLKQTWIADEKRAIQELWRLGGEPPLSYEEIVSLFQPGGQANLQRGNRPILLNVQKNETEKKLTVDEEMRKAALIEYLETQYRAVPVSGLIPKCDNSSKEPKTLGAIATQLLMSRLPYDGNEQ